MSGVEETAALAAIADGAGTAAAAAPAVAGGVAAGTAAGTAAAAADTAAATYGAGTLGGSSLLGGAGTGMAGGLGSGMAGTSLGAEGGAGLLGGSTGAAVPLSGTMVAPYAGMLEPVGGAGAWGTGMAGISLPTAAETAGATEFVTPAVTGDAAGEVGQAGLSSADKAALYSNQGYGEAAQPGLLEQAAPYLQKAGQASSAYSAMNPAQPQRQAPQGRPIYTGQAAPIAQQQQPVPENEFARMLLEKRMRGGMMS